VVDGGGVALGELRNRGARVASGDVLAFVDADVLLAPAWPAAALDALAGGEFAAAGAPYHAPPDSGWVARTYDLLRPRGPRRRSTRWVPAGAMAVRREAFEKVGGFDPRLASCEDIDLCRRLRGAGFGVAYDPGLRSIHCGDPRTLRELFAGEMRRGAANLRVSTRRHAIGELPSLLVSLAVLSLLVLLAPGLVAAATGQAMPLVAVAVALGLLIAARTVQMVRAGGWRSIPAAVLVGVVYEAGRAAALVKGSRDARSRATERLG
jgi:GT2 family glycosyltransferase